MPDAKLARGDICGDLTAWGKSRRRCYSAAPGGNSCVADRREAKVEPSVGCPLPGRYRNYIRSRRPL